MDTTFDILGLTGHAYGLCATAAALAVLAGIAAVARHRHLPVATAGVFGLVGIPLGIACARILYCLVHLGDFWETYEDPWLMLRFFDGGLSMPGLLAGLVLAALLSARLLKVRFAEMADALCLPLGLGIALLRLGERFTDLGVGKAVPEGALTAAAPWLFLQSRMGVAVEYRINVWACEAAAAVVIFAATLAFFRRKRAGDTALFFFSLYGAAQTLLESLRDDGHMLFIFLRVSQVAAALMPVIALAVLGRRAKKGRLWPRWAAMALCAAGIALLEFSLDGRLAWAAASPGRDYALMALLCCAMFLLPASLLRGGRAAGRRPEG